MKILIIGGVAAGTKAAAKIKRCNRDATVKILTKSNDISYARCLLPYYIGGAVEDKSELIVNSPEQFSELTGTQVMTGCEVTAINSEKKSVTYSDSKGNIATESYDKLVISTGATPIVPDIDGTKLSGVFVVRTPGDAIAIREYIRQNNCKKALVCGAGFIGLEVAENLLSSGLDVTVIDSADSIMPNAFDKEMADYAKRQLQSNSVRVMTGTAITGVIGNDKVTGIATTSGSISGEIVILALGIRPATAFLDGSGIETDRGAILVDENMKTNIEDIYSAGDCAEIKNRITGERQWSPMGSTANITARLLAKNICGINSKYPGSLATGIAKILSSLNCGKTGLTESQAKASGFDPISVISVLDDKAKHYPDSSSFIIKAIADKNSRKLLGVQVMGSGEIDKIIDIAVTGISMGAVVDDFDTLDFAYAPPFSTAISPFVTACNILENKLSGELESFTPYEYSNGMAKDYTVIDVQPVQGIPGAKWIDLGKADKGLDGIAKDEKLLLVCTRGRRGYLLQNILKHLGYTNTKVLEGGVTFNRVKVERKGQKLSDDDIKRVKGLGCLQDKRFDDIFNVRVITRNGKITSSEQIAIAEAAEKYGSGEVTMTTRMTLEIQGVPFDNLDDLFDYLNDAGLETGGTGSKVRPVVSCKGTTCQYGLIDTFGLSEKLHKIFYEDYHGLVLPHKFKIAVGGCPNNCVKPNLNDIGIVGQRLPEIDYSKCRGCKVCQIEKSCPIKVAKLSDSKIVIDENECNHCGRCIGKCPFGAVNENRTGYKIYIGGRWGKKVAMGRPLTKIFSSEEEVIDTVDRAIMFFRNEGLTGERFADTVSRLGFDYVNEKLINGEIDKAKIISKTVIGGATC